MGFIGEAGTLLSNEAVPPVLYDPVLWAFCAEDY
jgi:hypothetical protein